MVLTRFCSIGWALGDFQGTKRNKLDVFHRISKNAVVTRPLEAWTMLRIERIDSSCVSSPSSTRGTLVGGNLKARRQTSPKTLVSINGLRHIFYSAFPSGRKTF